MNSLSGPGQCFAVERVSCCFDAPPHIDLCLTAPSNPMCFTAEENQMSYSQVGNCCVPKRRCCIESCSKRADETEVITFRWHAVAGAVCDGDGKITSDGEWSLVSVTHTITQHDGAALAGGADDPVIALKVDNTTPMNDTFPHKYLSRVGIRAGEPGEKYRVTAVATFKNCDGYRKIVGYCVNLRIEDCA
jgi:predicted RNA-binding protein with TRAM domain